MIYSYIHLIVSPPVDINPIVSIFPWHQSYSLAKAKAVL